MFRGLSGRRRLLAVALAGLLAIVSWTGLIVLDLGDDLPSHVEVPPRHVGDAFTYEFKADGAGNDVPAWVSYRWAGTETVTGPWGDAVAVQRLEAWTETTSTTLYVTPSGHVVAQDIHAAERRDDVEAQQSVRRDYPDDQRLCGLVVPFQGDRMPAQDTVPLAETCIWPLVPQEPAPPMHLPGSAMRLAAVEERIERQAARFDSTRGEQYWFAAGVPVALAASAPLGDGVLHATLIAFTAGDGDVLRSAEEGPATTVLAKRPVSAWGPDPTGVDWPWHPEEAFAAAQAAATAGALRAFLQDHPDASAFYARATDTPDVDGVSTHQSWMFSLRSGDETLTFLISRLVPRDADAPLPAAVFSVRGDPVPVGPDRGTADALAWQGALARLAAVGTLDAHGDRTWTWALRSACPDPCVEQDWTFTVQRPQEDDLARALEGASGTDLEPASDRVSITVDDTGRIVSSLDSSRQSVPGLHPQPDRALPAPESVGPFNDPAAGGLPAAVPWAAMGLVAAIVGLLYWAWPLLRRSPLVVAFTRIKPHAVLEHPTRRRIMEALAADPGIHYMELAKRLDLTHSVLTHHLKALLLAGNVAEAAGKGYTCYFVKGAVDRRVMAAMPVVKSETARRILAAVQASPGLSVSDVGAGMDVSLAATHKHVRRLAHCGLLRTERQGRKVCLFAEPLARETLGVLEGNGNEEVAA